MMIVTVYFKTFSKGHRHTGTYHLVEGRAPRRPAIIGPGPAGPRDCLRRVWRASFVFLKNRRCRACRGGGEERERKQRRSKVVEDGSVDLERRRQHAMTEDGT